MKKEEIYDVLAKDFFTKSDSVKNAMIEMMTLKTLLIGKGVITEEEFDSLRPKVAERIETEVEAKIRSLLDQDVAAKMFIDLLAGTFRKKDEPASN
jgi:TPP-dependent pyruvate/acetoin dehydrogenase alpha subunit